MLSARLQDRSASRANRSMNGMQRLALAATTATYFIIVMGATVRVTGSGLGCPDWPLCHGSLIPPLELTALIEYFHRLVAAIGSPLILAVVFGAWRTRRHKRSVVGPAAVLPLLLATQIGLGAITVLLELPPWIVLVHLSVALMILGLLVVISVFSGDTPGVSNPAALKRVAVLSSLSAVALFLLLLTGGVVRAAGATWACAGFPGCDGTLFPFGRDPLTDLQLFHRTMSYGVLVLLAFTLVRAWQAKSIAPELGAAVLAVLGAGVFQFVVGANMVSLGAPPLLRGLHVAGASAVWVSVVLLASLAVRSASAPPLPAGAEDRTAAGNRGVGDLASAYLVMMKPSIISLLLVTTLASMLVAARGFPPFHLVVATLLGGALAAGAANTFNCYMDRDIDGVMQRTSHRPIPAGIVTPRQALTFGFALAILAMLLLGLIVNWLAAALSLGGLLYYVFVYTWWLKRSTPSNIVLGGAAGAVPPLVGWAAVTGEVSVLAVYLFAVIFFWTPPHFWALALLIRREYERAAIPMLPVVSGEAETRRQIVFYSLWLVAFTLLVVFIQEVGLIYITSALLLGGLFIYYAARLFREATSAAARGMFRYSILYLAFLFFALVIDRWRL